MLVAATAAALAAAAAAAVVGCFGIPLHFSSRLCYGQLQQQHVPIRLLLLPLLLMLLRLLLSLLLLLLQMRPLLAAAAASPLTAIRELLAQQLQQIAKRGDAGG